MNHHYIDYIIKEQQREELEACERRRLLNSADYPKVGLIRKAGNSFISAVCRLRENWSFRCRRLYPCLFITHDVAQKKGGINDVA